MVLRDHDDKTVYIEKGIVSLESALYPALFLAPDEDISTALETFRKAGRPMALVREADGPILGMITLENVLEEIVGDIEDEHDRPTPRPKLRPGPSSPRQFVLQGRRSSEAAKTEDAVGR